MDLNTKKKNNLEVPRDQEKAEMGVSAKGSLLWLIEMLRYLEDGDDFLNAIL